MPQQNEDEHWPEVKEVHSAPDYSTFGKATCLCRYHGVVADQILYDNYSVSYSSIRQGNHVQPFGRQEDTRLTSGGRVGEWL